MRVRNFFTKLTTVSMVAAMLLTMGNSAKAQEEKEDGFTFGGAVRFNIFDKSWVDNKTQPEATWDTWRLNVDGSKGGIDLSFEYRFYPTFATHFIHHGWLGYAFSEDVYMKLGVTQVPFGITKYASHSWWFQGQYYVGLEDDMDMGVKFDISKFKNLDLSIAYFRQAEPEGPVFGGMSTFGAAGSGRYSYDITPGVGSVYNETTGTMEVVDADIRELNQFNLRAAYHVSDAVEIGASAQFGGIYNKTLDEAEMSSAFAGHMVANFGGGFNFKGSYIYHNYTAKADDGRDLDVIQMGAYGTPYDVATEANIYAVGLAYSFDVDWGPISNINAYVDYTMVDKVNENFEDWQHLVPGFMITSGSVYTYVDWAWGYNQPWLGAFGKGAGQGNPDAEWENRFNINIGYYF